ncbi:MAG: endolytic transglycosylase MltG [Defluviitaleaceae bacterium]|nr:endolytic transglycosylase MltG [Defluviitaleaceae bacterium]
MNNANKLLKFLIGIVINVTVMLLVVYALIIITGRSFDMGQDIVADLVGEYGEGVEIEIEVSDDVRVNDLANILAEAGIINSPLLFRLENILQGTNHTITAGTYTLNTTMNSIEIVNTLRQNNAIATDVVITIREGFRLVDIAEYLETMGFFTAEEFLFAANHSRFNHSFLVDIPIRENQLEGYLFPDTYRVFPNSTPEMIINRLLDRFEEIYAPHAQSARAMGLTMDEVIIIASIIERETRIQDEKEHFSQIIHNRLEAELPLNMPSTISYVVDRPRDRLSHNDFNIDSPFNTFIHDGLPVGPISNPSEASIIAAINPSSGNLLYFIMNEDEPGEHIFSHEDNFGEDNDDDGDS